MRVAILALCTAAGLLLGGAAAAVTTDSGWHFYAEWGSGADHRCAAHRAELTFSDPGLAPYGWIRKRAGTPCEPNEVPPGHLGVKPLMQRGDGAICATSPWVYNPSPNNSFYAMPGTTTGNCNSGWVNMRAGALGRAYNSNTALYVTADNWVYSPYVSAP